MGLQYIVYMYEGSPRTPQNGRKPLFPNQT